MNTQVIIIGLAVIYCNTVLGLFVPGRLQENKLVRALLDGYSETRIYTKIVHDQPKRSRKLMHKHCHKYPGSLHDQYSGTANVKDYLQALLQHHQIVHRDEQDAVICATEHLGGCSRMYPSILGSWGRFFENRTFQARVISPQLQQNDPARTVAIFGRNALTGYTGDDIQAVDLIVGRTSVTNQVVYGRYHFRVSTMGNISVYDDQQATCGADEHSYFVLGLNEAGIDMVRSWINGEQDSIELSLQSQTMKQISHGSSTSFVRSHLGVEGQIEAMILHLKGSAPRFSKKVFPELYRRRRTRRAWKAMPDDCQRKTYQVDFHDIKDVIQPEIVDIGICTGDCDRARWPTGAKALNSTTHTLKILWSQYDRRRPSGNPPSKACCFPNKYSSFYFLTLDHLQNLYVDNVVDMIAQTCSCR